MTRAMDPIGAEDLPPIESMSLEESLAQLQKVMLDTPAAAEETALKAVRDEFRKRQRNLVLVIGAVIFVIVAGGLIVGSILFDRISTASASNREQDAALARTQATIDAFEGQLDVANASLRAQGLPEIVAPNNPAPGSPEQAELITAAGTATTLANLPREVMVAPTPQALAAAVADYVAANQGTFAPSPDAVINGVAAYFERNPIPEGREGPQGEEGPEGPRGPQGLPPTAEEIRVAFRDEIAANPQLLCPQGGDYSLRQVIIRDAQGALRVTPQFGCWGDDGDEVTINSGGDPGDEPGNPGGGGAVTPPPDPTGGATTGPTPVPPDEENPGGVTTTPPSVPPSTEPPEPPDEGLLPLLPI